MAVCLSEFEMRLGMSAFGVYEVKGFEALQMDVSSIDKEELKRKFTEQDIMERTEKGTYRFTALGSYMFRILAEADAWIRIEDEERALFRWIYVKGADYLCVDRIGEMLSFVFLPLLPVAIGAYADALEGIGGNRSLDNGESDCDWKAVYEQGKEFLKISGEINTQDFMRYCFVRQDSGLCVGKWSVNGDEEYELVWEDIVVNKITSWLLQGLNKKGDGEDEFI